MLHPGHLARVSRRQGRLKSRLRSVGFSVDFVNIHSFRSSQFPCKYYLFSMNFQFSSEKNLCCQLKYDANVQHGLKNGYYFCDHNVEFNKMSHMNFV